MIISHGGDLPVLQLESFNLASRSGLRVGLVTVTVTAGDSLREVSSLSYLCSPGLACRPVGPSLRARRTAGWFFPDLNEPATGSGPARITRCEQAGAGWDQPENLASRFGRQAITDTVTLPNWAGFRSLGPKSQFFWHAGGDLKEHTCSILHRANMALFGARMLLPRPVRIRENSTILLAVIKTEGANFHYIPWNSVTRKKILIQRLHQRFDEETE
jgi:hypothetical protein